MTLSWTAFCQFVLPDRHWISLTLPDGDALLKFGETQEEQRANSRSGEERPLVHG